MLAGAGILSLAACSANGSAGLTTPSRTPGAGDQLLALTVSCQAALLIGEREPCIAVASYGSGRNPIVSTRVACIDQQHYELIYKAEPIR